MKYFSFFITISILQFFISCSKTNKNDLELIVENDKITNSGIENKNINIIKYYIRNNSDKTYYINNLDDNQLKTNKLAIYSNGINIRIYSQDNSEINYNFSHFKKENAECVYDVLMDNADIYEKSLGYKNRVSYFRNFGFKNFFIHPKEIIYFELPIDLSGPVGYEEARIGYADLNTDKKYYAKISFASDSTTYKTSLPRDILKTINANNAEVFSGKIESVKIPIKFVK